MTLFNKVSLILGFTVYSSIGLALSAIASPQQESITLADFEWDAIPVVRKYQRKPETRDLWSQYTGDFSEKGDAGLVSITSEYAVKGNKSLKVEVTGGNVYLQFYTYTDKTRGWEFTRENLDPNETKEWKFDTYNRLKFWVKLPPGIESVGGGRKNGAIGTYVRSKNGAKKSAESGGHHFYHYIDIPSTGEWHQFIMDFHPDHNRGASGKKEHGVQEYPTFEPNYNYFDAMTRFYFELDRSLKSYPANFYFDGFEFYRETREGDAVDDVFGLNGTYIPAKNEVVLAWRRNKMDKRKTHEVRYAFEDIHTLGWDKAKEAPNGIVTPPNKHDYNGMDYYTNQIEMGKNKNIYFAIKRSGATHFRQIMFPVVDKR